MDSKPPPSTSAKGDPSPPSSQSQPRSRWAKFKFWNRSDRPNYSKELFQDYKSLPERYRFLFRAYFVYPRIGRLIIGGLFLSYSAYAYYTFNKRQRDYFTVKDGAILKWRFNRNHVTEVPPEKGIDAIANYGSNIQYHPISLLDAIRILKWAKTDDRVKGNISITF